MSSEDTNRRAAAICSPSLRPPTVFASGSSKARAPGPSSILPSRPRSKRPPFRLFAELRMAVAIHLSPPCLSARSLKGATDHVSLDSPSVMASCRRTRGSGSWLILVNWERRAWSESSQGPARRKPCTLTPWSSWARATRTSGDSSDFNDLKVCRARMTPDGAVPSARISLARGSRAPRSFRSMRTLCAVDRRHGLSSARACASSLTVALARFSFRVGAFPLGLSLQIRPCSLPLFNPYCCWRNRGTAE